jgi:hypothetical protein
MELWLLRELWLWLGVGSWRFDNDSQKMAVMKVLDMLFDGSCWSMLMVVVNAKVTAAGELQLILCDEMMYMSFYACMHIPPPTISAV